MKFTPELLQKSIKAMDNLIEHPISYIFICPLTDSDDNVINNDSVTLLSIKNRLQNNYYQDTYSWLCDVETVFHNVEDTYSELSLEASLSREMRKIFNKERRFLMQYSNSLWSNNMHALRVKLVTLIHSAPNKVKSQIPQFAFVELPKPRHLSFTAHEIQCFQIALEMLEGEEEQSGLANIINRLQPDAFQNVTPVSLNIGQLSDSTLRALRDYMINCLKKRNLKYPE